MIWSSDIVADDWRRISPKKVLKLALDRLDERGRGILLLHDIQKRTGTALPDILKELKKRNYKIVHVISADADHAKTATTAEEWLAGRPARKVGDELRATFDGSK
jgi:peptidoglycan/xylan/chitin deacetylase (PgdA/CDA1 family)